MEALIDLFLHFDTHLKAFVEAYGVWMYAALFLVIFAETGLVVTPFLPGDSLLFAAGALAATGAFNIWLLLALLTIAAVLAGAGTMTYSTFAFYNISGAIIWVGICTLGGYAFGNVPIVRDNFTLVALGIVAVSLLPIVVEYMRHK